MSVIWEKKQSSNGLLMCFACAVIPKNTFPAAQKMRNEILRERERALIWWISASPCFATEELC